MTSDFPPSARSEASLAGSAGEVARRLRQALCRWEFYALCGLLAFWNVMHLLLSQSAYSNWLRDAHTQVNQAPRAVRFVLHAVLGAWLVVPPVALALLAAHELGRGRWAERATRRIGYLRTIGVVVLLMVPHLLRWWPSFGTFTRRQFGHQGWLYIDSVFFYGAPFVALLYLTGTEDREGERAVTLRSVVWTGLLAAVWILFVVKVFWHPGLAEWAEALPRWAAVGVTSLWTWILTAGVWTLAACVLAVEDRREEHEAPPEAAA